MFGLFLIIIGIILILQEAGVIEGKFWNYAFAVILIIFGIMLIDRSKHKRAAAKNKQNTINGQ